MIPRTTTLDVAIRGASTTGDWKGIFMETRNAIWIFVDAALCQKVARQLFLEVFKPPPSLQLSFETKVFVTGKKM